MPRPRAEPLGSVREHRQDGAYEEKEYPGLGAEVRDHESTPAGDGQGISEAARGRAPCRHDEAGARANRMNERQEMEKRGSRDGRHDLVLA